MNDKIKKGCDDVYEFYEGYWIKETKGSSFDPTSSKFKELPQEIASLMLLAIQYGAVTACPYFSSKPRKLKKEFAYYLSEKIKVNADKAKILAQTIYEKRDNVAVQHAILMGKKIYRKWSEHKV